MKVIDLLNKIADREEVPEHIKLISGIELYYCEDTLNYYNELGCNELFNSWIAYNLNDEVEIIEEDKEIEKLERINGSYLVDLRSDNSIEEQSEAITNLIIYLNNNVDKINELVKAVNELKKGK